MASAGSVNSAPQPRKPNITLHVACCTTPHSLASQTTTLGFPTACCTLPVAACCLLSLSLQRSLISASQTTTSTRFGMSTSSFMEAKSSRLQYAAQRCAAPLRRKAKHDLARCTVHGDAMNDVSPTAHRSYRREVEARLGRAVAHLWTGRWTPMFDASRPRLARRWSFHGMCRTTCCPRRAARSPFPPGLL